MTSSLNVTAKTRVRSDVVASAGSLLAIDATVGAVRSTVYDWSAPVGVTLESPVPAKSSMLWPPAMFRLNAPSVFTAMVALYVSPDTADTVMEPAPGA